MNIGVKKVSSQPMATRRGVDYGYRLRESWRFRAAVTLARAAVVVFWSWVLLLYLAAIVALWPLWLAWRALTWPRRAWH